MSWEEMSRKSIECPCGRGMISQASYMDDWNRWEDGPVEIECDFAGKTMKSSVSIMVRELCIILRQKDIHLIAV